MAVAALVLVSALAPAAAGRAVTLEPTEFEGELEPHWQREIEARIAEGFSRGDRSLEDDGPRLVVSSRIGVVEKDFTLELRVRDARDEAVLATATDSCGLCGAQEAADMAEDLAAILRSKVEALARSQPAILVSSDPPGARVTIDDRAVGVAPVQLELGAGRHTIRIDKHGYVQQTRTITAVAGVRDDLRFDLDVSARDWRRPAWISGWAAFGGGVATIAAGATLIAIDGRPYRSDCRPDADGDCRNLYETKTGGIVALSVGAAATVAAIALVVASRHHRDRAHASSRLRFVPASGGLAIGF